MNTISNIIGNYESQMHANESVQKRPQVPQVGENNRSKNATVFKSNKLVNLSEASKMALLAHQSAVETPDIRHDKVMALKSAIQNGTYQIDAGTIAERFLQSAL